MTKSIGDLVKEGREAVQRLREARAETKLAKAQAALARATAARLRGEMAVQLEKLRRIDPSHPDIAIFEATLARKPR
jgi:hypothetical protein